MAQPQKERTQPARAVVVLLGLAGFCVVVGGMKLASPVIVPFLLSAFLAILSAPPMLWLERKGFPRAVAIALVFTGVFVTATFLGQIVFNSANRFLDQDLEHLERSLEERSDDFLAWMERKGVSLERFRGRPPAEPGEAAEAPPTGPEEEGSIDDFLDFAGVVAFVRSLFQGLTSALGKTFLIFLTVFFILLEISSFPLKFNLVFPSTRESLALRRFTRSIRNYIAIKTATSLATGILIGLWLALCGVKYPVLWGLLAFLLNFIPNVGSVLAAFPPALLALIDNGWETLLAVLLAYSVVNILIGSILEPRIMGRGLGLSPLVVFASLVFWGWVFGPIGMFLSVPLTMTIKIALESNADTRWIAVFLGSEADAKLAMQPMQPGT